MELPEGCIANIISRTTPPDACRLSVVSKLFHSAAESDSVWCRFLPSDVVSIVSQIDDDESRASQLSNSPSKKALYLALSDRPIIIDQGKMSFQLERKSGKKRYMIAARALTIIWGGTPEYWNWTTMPESRFTEVARLVDVCWLEIRGVMNTIALSPNTQYAAYLVFNMVGAFGFDNSPVELSVGIFGGETSTKNVCLDPNTGGRRPSNRVAGLQRPNARSDGWLEIEMGVFFNSGIENEELQMRLMEVKGGHWKRGLTIQGIEVRPKEDNIEEKERRNGVSRGMHCQHTLANHTRRCMQALRRFQALPFRR